MILLRFRDLSIPNGETIRRHSEIAHNKDYVWWGWIMRQDETFPRKHFVDLSRRLEKSGEEIRLLHSGTHQLFSVTVSCLHASLEGVPIKCPELSYTPKYMHESLCFAWFQLNKFSEENTATIAKIDSFPTLKTLSASDEALVAETDIETKKFSASAATLWDITP